MFLESLSEESTKAIQWDNFQAIVIPGAEDSEALRPTLYDLLLHRALNHFRSNDALVSEPTYSSTLNDLYLLSPVEDFVWYEWQTTGPVNRTEHLLRLLQQGLSWRLLQGNEAALLDLDLLRLRYVYEHLQGDEKEVVYYEALEQLRCESYLCEDHISENLPGLCANIERTAMQIEQRAFIGMLCR